MFSEFRPAVEQVLKDVNVRRTSRFGELVRDELASGTPAIHHHSPDKKRLDALYDLRSHYLDWELGTGYVGFFSENAGTRYTFTRRLEVVLQMLSDLPTPCPSQEGNSRIIVSPPCPSQEGNSRIIVSPPCPSQEGNSRIIVSPPCPSQEGNSRNGTDSNSSLEGGQGDVFPSWEGQGVGFQPRILEIGCGAGILCLELARRAEWVVGIDISHVVLDFANRVKDEVQYKNISFQHGDAENLAFGDKCFDLVICSEVLEHLLSPQKALREMRRVLKKDGTLILTTPCAVSLSDIFMDLFRLVNPHVESEKDVQFDKKTYLAAQRKGEQIPAGDFMRIHSRFRYQDLETMFQQAGFEVQQAVGTVFAFPPHYQVFYRYCPGFLLPGVRLLENVLNRLGIFQRFGSVTTCFLLKQGEFNTEP